MPFEIGTATDHYDLLDKLITFVTTNAALVSAGQNWQLVNDQITPNRTLNGGPAASVNASDYRDVYLRAPGLANQENIHINIMAWDDPVLQLNNWRVFGATGYDELQNIEYQPGGFFASIGGISPGSFYILSNAAMPYWIVANGRRLMLVVKIEGDFYFLHMGFVLPYAKPSEVPFPCLISANDNISTSTPSTTTLYNLGGNAAADSRGQFRNINGQWGYVGNTSGVSGGIPYLEVWPYGTLWGQPVNDYQPVGDPTGGYPIFPAILFSTASGYEGVHGEVQGFYHVPKVGNIDLQSEDTLTIDGKTYLVFQNVDKNSRYDYSAMILE